MPRWFYKRDGQEFGPLTELGMRELIARGRLSGSSAVRRYDDDNPDHEYPWQDLERSQLADRLAASPVPQPAVIEIPMPAEPRVTQLPASVMAANAVLTLWCLLELLYLGLTVPGKIANGLSGSFVETAVVDGFAGWFGGLGSAGLVLHVILVMIWQARAAEVAPLYGAEVALYRQAAALYWLVPGLNFYHCRHAMIEIWSLAKDPRAWNRGGLRSCLTIDFWWLSFVAACLAAVAQFMIRRNLGKALTDGRMDQWRAPLSFISAGRDCLWAIHLVLLLVLVWKIYQRQKATLRNPPKRRVRTD